MEYLTPGETALGLIILAGAGSAVLLLALLIVVGLDKAERWLEGFDEPWRKL